MGKTRAAVGLAALLALGGMTPALSAAQGLVPQSPEALRALALERGVLSFDAGARAALLRELRSRLGESIGVRLTEVAEIPREKNGKFRAVKSTIDAARFNTEAADTDD